MKIWIFARGYPTLKNNHLGAGELNEAKLLAKHGHDVTFIVSKSRERHLPDAIYHAEGVKVVIATSLFRRQPDPLPDIILVHDYISSDIRLIDQYRSQGVKVLFTEYPLEGNLTKRKQAKVQYFKENCISLSPALNPISPLFFFSHLQQKTSGSKNDEDFTFLCIGSLVKHNHIDAVIRQYKTYFQNKKDVALRIIGYGPEETRLGEEAEGRVYFTNQTADEDVAWYIADSDALISFTNFDEDSVVKAWAVGKPVIVKDNSLYSGFVEEENGLLVSSELELGAAMRKICKKRFNRESISSFAETHFSEDAIYRQIMNSFMNTQ